MQNKWFKQFTYENTMHYMQTNKPTKKEERYSLMRKTNINGLFGKDKPERKPNTNLKFRFLLTIFKEINTKMN